MNTVEMSIDLRNVLRAVTLNGKSLAITSIFGVMIVYLFAIWAFVSFRNHYDNDGELLCLDLFQCTVATLGGLRKGDVGELLSDTEWGNPWFIIFQLGYFAVVITILLNIIFGIIIDTFGELRATKAAIEEDMSNKCFICSIDQYTFERNTEGGFEHHIKKEHNMWRYVYFMVHLNIKDPNEYTGAEDYVKDLVIKNDASWFPINQAIKLVEHLAKQEAAQTKLSSTVEATSQKTIELEKKLDKLLVLIQTVPLASSEPTTTTTTTTPQRGLTVGFV
jgi:inositol 1,4,5-triphosphate receptor type 1